MPTLDIFSRLDLRDIDLNLHHILEEGEEVEAVADFAAARDLRIWVGKPGDIVRIEETRPLSKRKRWIVREIVERGVQI